MKINSAIPSIGNTPESNRSGPAKATAHRPAAAAATQVELSPLSSRIQGLEATLSASPVVDAQRVAEIKQAIAEGRFKVDPERIADGLLKSVREMLEKNADRQ